MTLSIESRKANNVLFIKVLNNKLDAEIASELKKQLMDVIEDGQTNIVLNLGEVSFIDSSGLGTIVSVSKALTAKGELVLTQIQDSVMHFFELTRLNRLFRFTENDETALELLA